VDRSLKLTYAQWEALLARIQSPSRELESELARSNANVLHALTGLEELEKLTQTHLQPHLEPRLDPDLAPPAPSAAAPSVQPPAPVAPVRYQTSHDEYAPALNQSALVEALLQYQRKKALRNPKPVNGTSTGAKERAAQRDLDTPAFSRSDFAPMRIPAIEAEPKASPLGRATSSGVRLPVLRLKTENPNAEGPKAESPFHDEQD
jgi:hypothetical protein